MHARTDVRGKLHLWYSQFDFSNFAVPAFLVPRRADRAQFEEADPAKAGMGPKLDQALTKKIKIGVSVKAVGGPCKGIVCTVPFPIDWPEQKVKIRRGRSFARRASSELPHAGAGAEANDRADAATARPAKRRIALVTFEITRYSANPPEDTSVYKECAKDKLPKEVVQYLGTSPFIESTHPKIVALAKEVTEDKSDWEKVEAIYEATREKVKYQNGPLKGALKATARWHRRLRGADFAVRGPCRASGIPARSVWVPDHCYPEFYLVDADGKGYWFPCQAAGSRAFGGIPEHRPILQKGDNFRDPDRPKEHFGT